VSDDSQSLGGRTGPTPGRSENAPQNEGPAAFDPKLTGVSGPLDTLTFEELVAALERVASRLAGGDLGIEAAADLYEQAELLYEAAQERLAAVEARIERLGPPGQG
jgi:exodeoxyribonuclease VII small subunit